MVYLRNATASQEITLGYFVDSIDGDSEKGTLTIANTDIKLWKHGATTLANKNSGGATSISSSGIYSAVLDATDTDTIGNLTIFCHVSTALAVKAECVVLPAKVYDAIILGTVNLEVDAVKWLGQACAAVSANGVPKVDTEYWRGSQVAAVSVNGVPEVDLTHINGATQSVANLKDFADDGYDPSANKVRGVALVDTVTALTGNTVQTGDCFARIGAPVGASISVDVAAVKTQTAAIETDTQDLQTNLATVDGVVDDIKTAVTGTVDANLVSIDGAATDDNSATLKLKSLHIYNTSGSAMWCESTGDNGAGIYVKGHGNAAGLDVQGGENASGIIAKAGESVSVSASGLYLRGNGQGDGLTAVGGVTGNGIQAAGGDDTGDGIKASAGFLGVGSGITARGSIAQGSGIIAEGGYTGRGISARGGIGILAEGHGEGSSTPATGILAIGRGTANAILADSTQDGGTGSAFKMISSIDSKDIDAKEIGSPSGIVNANLVSIDGMDTDGNNAVLNLKQLNIQNSTGAALYIETSVGDYDAAYLKGSGDGSGLKAVGGDALGDGELGGAGGRFVGGNNRADGLVCQGTGGEGGSGGNGLVGAAGDRGSGIFARGGDDFGNGLVCTSPTEGHGIVGIAYGDGAGMNLVGKDVGGEGVNRGSGLALTGDGMPDLSLSADGVSLDSILTHLMAMVNGRFVKDGSTITFYKQNGTDVLFTVETDATGRERIEP